MSEPGKPPRKGVDRLVHALGYSWEGIRSCLRREDAFRQEICLAAVLLPAALWLDVSLAERLWLIFSVFFVLAVELLNTAIERIVDRISPEWHGLSKEAKDIGSAAVLFSLIFAAAVWISVLLSLMK